jgi:hypothetical protein|nr:MAG TPA: hypothetical protein [Caudoviricetes sp.]
MNDYIDLIEFKDDIESIGLAIADISVKLSRDKDGVFNWMTSDTRREISDTLSKYADYGRMVVSEARSLPAPVVGQEVLAFRDIQPFLFPKFDYASIVLATNDILNAKNEDADIHNTLSLLLQKYFNIHDTSDIWQLFEMGIKSVHPSETLDNSYFTSIRGNLTADTSIVGIILKALDTSVQACQDTLIVADMYTFTKLSSIFHEGYVRVAINTYMMQNWMLGEYVRGFDSDVPVTEATVNDFSSNFKGLSIFAKKTNMDWLNGDMNPFLTTLKEFICQLGSINQVEKVTAGEWASRSLGKELKKNTLYQLLEKHSYDCRQNGKNRPYVDRCYFDSLDSMFIDELKAIMQLKTISTDGNTFISPADEICNIVMSVPCGMTVDAVKKFALDLYLFAVTLPCDRSLGGYAVPYDRTATTQSGTSDEVRSLGIVHNTFKPIREAIWKRFGMIEEQYNDICVDEPQPQPYDLNIGDFITTEPQEQSYKKMQYPFVNDVITECYAMPFYIQESLRSEYLATLDAFKDSILFKEADEDSSDLSDMEGVNNQKDSTTQQNSSNDNMVNAAKKTLSNILDKVVSLIKGMIKRISDFIKKQSVAAAIKWVQDHKAELQNIKLSDTVTMPEWLVYRNPIKFNFTNRAMMAITPADTFEKYQEQLVSFYGDKKVYDWFNGDDSSNASQKYKNYILFNDDGTDPTPRVYSAADVAQAIPIWVNNITNLDDVVQQMEQISENLINNISAIKSKLSNEKDMSKINEYQNMLNAANKAVSAVVIPTPAIIIDAIMQQYQYIQFIYNNRATTN